MIVIDTSAVIGALAGRPVDEALVDRLRDDGDLNAPHLIDIEFLHALRRLVRGRDLTRDRAEEARDDFSRLPLERYPHTPLNDRVWELRQNLTAHDAAFVALAEALDVPLVTLDARLERGAPTSAQVELFAGR